MRVSGLKTWYTPTVGLLVCLSLQGAFVTASAIPSLASNVKRDDPATLVNSLMTNLKNAIPIASQAGINLFNQVLNGGLGAYTIPQESTDAIIRAVNLALVRTGFLYGPPLAGGPAYPSGLLGLAKDMQDLVNLQLEATPELVGAAADLAKATLDVSKVRE